MKGFHFGTKCQAFHQITDSEPITILLITMHTRRTPSRSSLDKSPSSSTPNNFSEGQIFLLKEKFQSRQYINNKEAEKLAKDLKMSVKQIKVWFQNMRRKVKNNDKKADFKIDDNNKQFDIKQPNVPVLRDLNTLKSLKNSFESGEIVLDDDEEDNGNTEEDVSMDEVINNDHLDISTLETSSLLKFDSVITDVLKAKAAPEDTTPLITKCTTTNEYIEQLLKNIEDLEDGIKEKEGDVYFMQKDLDEAKENLEAKERVLNTIQQSIPKVVKDHKDALNKKDAEILELQLKVTDMNETIKNYERVKKEHVKEDSNLVGQRDEMNKMKSLLSDKEKLCQELTSSVKQNEIKMTELENKNSVLQENLANKDDEIKILKFKLKQTEHMEFLNTDLKERLDKNQCLYKKLLEKEEKFQQNMSDLEFDLYSKTIEVKSMSDTINRLNEKIKDLQSNNSMEEVNSMNMSYHSSESDSLSFNHSVVNELFLDIINNI